MKIGFDFDNTLVEYDVLFHEAASTEGLIPKDLEQSKEAVKQYIHKYHTQQAFTELQGFVYGEMIKKAKPKKSLLNILSSLVEKRHQLVIISHKTAKPYSGPSYNLRVAAMQWLNDNHFIGKGGFFAESDSVFFENTIDKKVHRIQALRCDVFFDDLPNILDRLNKDIKKYHYDPKNSYGDTLNHIKFEDWAQLKLPF